MRGGRQCLRHQSHRLKSHRPFPSLFMAGPPFKLGLLLLLLGLVGATSAACGQGSVESPDATSASEQAVIRISGSGTCRPLVELLAQEYESRYGSVVFRFLPEMHSSGGIRGVADGALDVGLVSRDPTPEERELGLSFLMLSQDGLALAAHSADLGVDGVTTQQVRDIYAGRFTNWKQLGGPDAELIVLDRNEDESAKIILRQYVLGDIEVASRAVKLNQESDMVDGLVNTPNTFGYLSLGYALSREIPIHLLALDGISPTPENIEAGRYKMVRPLGLTYNPDPSPEVRAFLAFATSDEAKTLMRGWGFAPAPPNAGWSQSREPLVVSVAR